jgi:peptide methionine sulfoxide reductase msrA/msrB
LWPVAAPQEKHGVYFMSNSSSQFPGNFLNSKESKLTDFERYVIEKKGTEPAGSGLYTHHRATGTYHCKACGTALYESTDKFDSHCGWPSFDDAIKGAVNRTPDADGERVEITCARCGGHLGHVFVGEGFTPKNTRHCVNSVSLKFEAQRAPEHKTALFASGCFWGTEYFMARIPGVLKTTVGYAGGHMESPDYKSVCGGKTGHLECVEILYDPSKIDYRSLCKVFFETHDFSQDNGQGPDIGPQYLSAIFCDDDAEAAVASDLVVQLRGLGHKVATAIRPKARFWPAETYHQQYYERGGESPYCHRYRKIF